MVGRLRKCEQFSGFLYGMLLLLTLSANCSGDIHKQSKKMQHITGADTEPVSIIMLSDDILTLTEEMQSQAKELFNESVTEHEICVKQCKKHPDGTRVNLTNVLHRIDEALTDFRKAFDKLFHRHTPEYKHKKKLKEAREQILALHSKLLPFLKSYNKSLEDMLDSYMRKVLHTKYDQPHNEDFNKQKYECCQMIHVYKDFLNVIHGIIVKISNRRSKERKLLKYLIFKNN